MRSQLVFEVDPAEPVRRGGNGDDAAADVLEQQVGEREVAEVVGAELELEAVGRAGQRRHHDAGVVDEQVDFAVPGRGELAHRCQAGEIELAHLGLAGHRRSGRTALVESAHGEHDARAGAGQCPRRGGSDAAVGAGHDHAAAGHVVGVCCAEGRLGVLSGLQVGDSNIVGGDNKVVKDNILR